MNVFVLSTGRCGSETFARACGHMTNYTATHETHNPWLHPITAPPYRSLRFPDNHIEVDNRLTWFLGTLDREYGPAAYYVHLLRRREQVARSLVRRGDQCILYGFAHGILQYYDEVRWLTEDERYEIALHFWDTVNANIEQFLRDKPRTITVWLHEAVEPFCQFWHDIGAEGDLEAARAEWSRHYNPSRPDRAPTWCEPATAHQASVRQALAELWTHIPRGETFALLDEEALGISFAPAGRIRVSYPEDGGVYVGPPADDEAAVEALVRLTQRGVRFFVVGWPAFWWLDHYQGLARQLRNTSRCLLANERIQLYELEARPA